VPLFLSAALSSLLILSPQCTTRPCKLCLSAVPVPPALQQETNVTCTACAGTLLLEFGMLSEMTGDYRWRDLAEHAARVREGPGSHLRSHDDT
jgi:hypothetical protein